MTAYVGYYVDRTRIERRLSKAVVRRGYDDNNDGVADDDPVSQLIEDAEGMFEGYCRGRYPIAALRAAKPPEAVRIVLDVVDFLIAKRFPRAVNRNWMDLEASVRAELKNVANGLTRLDVEGLPSPPANVGGEVFNGTSAETIDPFEPVFINDFGSF
jgi:phage gp36-like protein